MLGQKANKFDTIIRTQSEDVTSNSLSWNNISFTILIRRIKSISNANAQKDAFKRVHGHKGMSAVFCVVNSDASQ